MSTSCGIPDFRSENGLYARLKVDYPSLPCPEACLAAVFVLFTSLQAMFSMDYFRSNQQPFFDFAREIYPGNFQPSVCHRFIAMLEKQGMLLR